MQYLKHPFHRNDLGNTTAIYFLLYDGPSGLTESERNQIKAHDDSTVLMNSGTLENILLQTRTRISATSTAGNETIGFLSSLTQKETIDAETTSIQIGLRRMIMQALGSTDVTPGLAFIFFYGSTGSTVRYAMFLSIGDENSDADIQIDSNLLEANKIYKCNDLVIKLTGLLGE